VKGQPEKMSLEPCSKHNYYLADGESAEWTEVALAMRVEGGFADLLTRRRLTTESQQWYKFYLETFAYRVDPRDGGR